MALSVCLNFCRAPGVSGRRSLECKSGWLASASFFSCCSSLRASLKSGGALKPISTGGRSDTGRSTPRDGDVMAALLEIRQLEVVYNRVATAIQGVSLDVPEGEIVALVGTNGAGKTTTLRAISGFLPSEDVAITDGMITLQGDRINGRMPHQLAKAGVILVP